MYYILSQKFQKEIAFAYSYQLKFSVSIKYFTFVLGGHLL